MARIRQPRRGRVRAALGAVIVVALSLAGSLTSTATANAASAQAFNPGNIISDELFYDGYALSAAEVQSFLNSKVTRCTIGDAGRTAGMTWGTTRIANACLRDFKLSTQTRAANSYCNAYIGAVNESAAQIIAKVAQACGVSPKVLLVMLEKEQSLISDSWPTVRQLDVAMGYACPDSGPNNSANCNSAYFGFYNQIYWSAWQIKVYLNNPNNFNYKPFQTNTIQWHPNAACGTSQVYIENRATASLYIYTPYRPNQAALNAGWGIGDSCSSYGNRNFFMFYTEWFGNPQFPTGTPVGEVKDLWTVSNGIRLWGWALDLDDRSAAVEINVRFGNSWAAATADQSNASAETLYPGSGLNHGFGMWIAAPPGTQQVCVWAKNIGSGVDRLLTCREVNVPSGNPVGEVKELWGTPGNINMWGWALDPDTVEPIDLHVSINGRWAVVKANAQNLAVGAAYPSHGNNHGFGAKIPAEQGNYRVCVYAINQGAGANTTLQCKDVVVPSSNPVGEVKELWGTPGNINMWGWALDPDTVEPIDLHVSINGRWAVVKANAQNLAAGAAYPGHGNNHGFGAAIPAETGNNRVCVYAINQGTGVNTTLVCKDVNVPSGDPVGQMKELWGVPEGIRMWGWAADPETSDPVDLHVRVDGSQWYVVRADSPYSAMPLLLPGVGVNHGFGAWLAALPGKHEVCTWIKNVGSGSDRFLGCQTVSS